MLDSFDAVVLDMDGVLTRTATLHARAWKRTFDEFLERHAKDEPPFDIEDDYLRYVDGKPRYEGARSFLESRGLELPKGNPSDAASLDTACGLGNRKDELFHELLDREGVEAFDDAVSQLARWRKTGLKTAVVSSSKNCGAVLARAERLGQFDVRVDGLDVERFGLDGKRGVFRTAAERLEVAPARAVAIEDAAAGVEAAIAEGYGLVVGVARDADTRRLEEKGAHLVVADLEQLDLPGRASAQSAGRGSDDVPPDASRHIEEIDDRIGEREVALFLDYDGTLTPIVDRPEQALLSDETRSLLDALSRVSTVAVVSGRDREDVAAKVGLERLIYAGSHGFDISGPDGLRMDHEDAREHLPQLDRAETELKERLGDLEGVRVERKAYAIAVHYRLAKNECDVERAKEIAREVRQGTSGLRETHGKKIVELGPDVDWDKGRAVEYLLEALQIDLQRTLPLYLGDDTTDEDAFTLLRRRDAGLGILVGPPARPSRAHYYLDGPRAAHRFLRRVLDTLVRRGS